MIPLTLLVFLAGTPVAESPAPAAEEIVNWDDYTPCGLVSLYLVCQMTDKAVTWEELKKLVGPPGPGGELSFAGLAAAAAQLGMNPVGLEVGRKTLQDLPMPAIVQVHDARYPDELPHFLVLLHPEADGVWLLDAPYAAYFLPEDRFQQSWTGKILLFARDEQEAQSIRGLAHGLRGLQWIGWGLVFSGVAFLPVAALLGWRRRPNLASSPSAATVRRTLPWGFIQLPRSKPLLVSSLLFFSIIALSPFLFLLSFQHGKDVPPCCDFGKQVMELGELPPGEHNIHVPIRNAGNRPLHIAQILSNCTCCAVVDGPKQIEPAQSAALNVRLTVIPGPRNVQLTVESDDPEGPKHILLSWHGKTKPTLLPRWIEAINVPLDRPYERTIRLIYPGGKSALVPHLKSCRCDRQGVEVREGRNDPLATKLSTLGLLTNIIGEMQLHIRVRPPSQPETIQTICKLSLTYGNDIQTLDLPLILSFSGGQLMPDVSSVTFSAGERAELLSQERVVRIADHDPRGEIEVSDLPSWLTCEIHRNSTEDHLLRLKIAVVPSVLPAQQTLHITRKGRASPSSTLRVHVLSKGTE